MGLFDSATGILQGDSVALEPLQAKLATGLTFFSKLIWYAVVIGIVGFVFWVFIIRYNSRCQVKIYRGDKLFKIKKDIVREFTDSQGKRKLQLFWLNKATPKPAQRYIKLLGKKDYYEFVMDDNGELHVPDEDYSVIEKGIIKKEIEVPSKNPLKRLMGKTETKTVEMTDLEVSPKIRLIPQDRVAWLLSENKLVEEKIRTKDRWKELAAIALPYVGLIIMFLLFYFGFQTLGTGMNDLAGQFGQVATSCLGR